MRSTKEFGRSIARLSNHRREGLLELGGLGPQFAQASGQVFLRSFHRGATLALRPADPPFDGNHFVGPSSNIGGRPASEARRGSVTTLRKRPFDSIRAGQRLQNQDRSFDAVQLQTEFRYHARDIHDRKEAVLSVNCIPQKDIKTNSYQGQAQFLSNSVELWRRRSLLEHSALRKSRSAVASSPGEDPKRNQMCRQR